MNLHKNFPYGGKCGVKSSPCGSSFKGFPVGFGIPRLLEKSQV